MSGNAINAERIFQQSDLPDDVTARLRTVLDRAALDASARADVAREFVAHFEDGLAAGRSLDELLRTFGEAATVARLIAQTKRPTTRTTMTTESGLAAAVGALLRNLRYAFRRLRTNPGFTTIAVLSLAVGIGANTAAFTLVEAIILRERPYANIDRLTEVYQSTNQVDYSVFSYPQFDALRRADDDVFSDLAAMRLHLVRVGADGDAASEMVPVEVVSGNYFPMVGLQAHLGRLIGPEDDVAPGAHPVIVLGFNYWRQRTGGAADVVGSTLQVSGRDYTIIGVAPPEYRGSLLGIEPSLFAPTMMVHILEPSGENDLENPGNQSYFLRAKLVEGLDHAQARAATPAIVSRVRQDLEWPQDLELRLVPTEDVIVFPPLDRFVRAAGWLVMSVVAVVLLVACANLASFLLARAVDRRREISIRMALGASRRSLLAQLVTETTVLAIVGGVVGSVLAVAGLKGLLALDLPLPIPLDFDVRLTGRVLLFTGVVSMITGIVFGLAPALHAARADIGVAMKPDLETRSGGRLPIRQILVVGQVAVSLVLLVAAGLFVRSLIATRDVDVGFGYEPAAVVETVLPERRYDADRGRLFVEELERALSGVPGVDAVGVIHRLHLNTLSTTTRDVTVEGVEPPPDRDGFAIDYAIVDRGFFDAAGIRIVQGRNFGPADGPESPPVGIVSQTMAERFWPDANAVGQTYRQGDTVVRVIGVASDTKVRTLAEAPTPVNYRPLSQDFSSYLTFVVRTTGTAGVLLPQVVDVIERRDPSVHILIQNTMARHIAVMLLPVHLAASAVGLFAALALALAAVGLYGVVSYAVARRTREVGIRISIGAPTAKVVRLMMGGGLKLVLIGAGIGLVLAFASARVLSSLLFGIDALDPVTFVAVPLAMGVVAAAAAYIPARRASRIDPVRALKTE